MNSIHTYYIIHCRREILQCVHITDITSWQSLNCFDASLLKLNMRQEMDIINECHIDMQTNADVKPNGPHNNFIKENSGCLNYCAPTLNITSRDLNE